MKRIIIAVCILFSFTRVSALPITNIFVKMGQSNIVSQELSDAFETQIKAWHADYPMIVINCGVGGTSIAEWQPTEPLFLNCMYAVHQAMQNGGRVVGFLWSQGERNALNCVDATNWNTLFETAADAARVHVYQPNAPIVLAQLGEAMPDYPCWGIVKNRQGLVGELHDTYSMNTMDIPRLNGVHYDYNGYLALGTKFANRINPYLP